MEKTELIRLFKKIRVEGLIKNNSLVTRNDVTISLSKIKTYTIMKTCLLLHGDDFTLTLFSPAGYQLIHKVPNAGHLLKNGEEE